MTNNSERGWWGVGYVYAQFIDRPGLALQALASVARPKVEFVSCMCPVWNLSWRPTDGSIDKILELRHAQGRLRESIPQNDT